MAKSSSFLIVFLTLPLFMMVLACGGCLMIFSRVKAEADARRAAMSPEERAAEDNRKEEGMAAIDAEIAAKRAVKDVLKAPDTAKFANVKVGRIKDEGWAAFGDVTAMNPMGVPLRQRFAVKLWRPEGARGASDFVVGSVAFDGKPLVENSSVLKRIGASAQKSAPNQPGQRSGDVYDEPADRRGVQ